MVPTAVLPVGDVNPTRRRAWVNWLLIAANLGVFLLATPWWASDCAQLGFYLEWATVPSEVLEGEPLGADDLNRAERLGCDVTVASDKNVYASLLYSMFLHGGWGHLLFNMLYLAIFGNNIEDRLGHLRYLAFYLATGLVATLAFVFANPTGTQTLVGASGAIAAVLGAYLVIFPTAWVTVVVPLLFFMVLRLPALIVLGMWFVLQLSGLRIGELTGGGVAYLAHVAGFLAGAAAVLLLGFRPERRPRPERLYSRYRRYP